MKMADPNGKFILSNNGSESKKVVVTTINDIPSNLLEMILSHLLLRDNIRASSVCKPWLEAAETVRVVEKPPWVMSFPKRGDKIDLFDPVEAKMYTLSLPEIDGTSVCYSNEGWLLMRRSTLVDLFLFNPYTREVIQLPTCDLTFQAIAFSGAPNSSTCAVVAFYPKSKEVILISMCNPGATEWITMKFPCSLPFDTLMHSNLVYANGLFYCFASKSVLFDFDVASLTLDHQAWEEHRCPYMHNDEWRFQPKRIYLTEQKGELFLMHTCGNETPMVYKLVACRWEEMTSATLDGLTIFASLYSLETRMDVLGMRNSVFFPKYGLHSMQCVSYSFDEGMYHPRKQLPKASQLSLMVKELCPLDSLWVEPPPCKDALKLKRSKGMMAKVT